MRVLLVEDDLRLGELLGARLCQDGYAVDWVHDRKAAEELAILTKAYALVVLDLGLPRKEGFALLANLRRGREPVPVMAIAARDTSPDCVIGLDLGADDCLVWPFNLDELAARVRTLLRRYRPSEPLTAISSSNIFR